MTALRLSFVLLFLALIALPGVQMAFPLIKDTPIEENRTLTKFPALQAHDVSSFTKWTAGLSPWFNDNFGFRAELIRAWNEISMRFGYSERVYLGPDHWLNYRHIMDDSIVGFARLSDNDIERVGAQFVKMRDYLAANNMRLLIVPVPQKEHVYPESLPRSAPHISSPTAFDKLRTYLTEHFRNDHIDAKAILMRLKAEGQQVYHKTDYHWTDLAGGEVGKAITNRIAELEGRPDLAWTAPIPDKPLKNWSGGESRFLPLFSPITEDTHMAAVRWNDPTQGTFEPLGTDPPSVLDDAANHQFTWRASAQAKVLLPPIAVLDNSYGLSFWRAGMHFHFRKVYHYLLRLNEKDFMADTLSTLPTDVRYVILQFHEAHMAMAAAIDWDKVK